MATKRLANFLGLGVSRMIPFSETTHRLLTNTSPFASMMLNRRRLTSSTNTIATVEDLCEELSKANIEIEVERSKASELEDKYRRALADSENLRTRLTKQIQDQKLFAIQNFCKDLTDIEDILRLAVESVPKQEISQNKHLKELYEGLTMTEARLLQVFKRHGLIQISPLNDKFDPNEHEAVVVKEEEGKDPGTVIFVSKLGYKLHDRVIRPAVVGVSK